MLPVAVKLNRGAVALFVGIAHPRAKRPGKSQIDRQIERAVAVRAEYLCGVVGGTVVHDQIVRLREFLSTAFHDALYAARLVVSRNNDQDFFHAHFSQ